MADKYDLSEYQICKKAMRDLENAMPKVEQAIASLEKYRGYTYINHAIAALEEAKTGIALQHSHCYLVVQKKGKYE